MRIRKRSGALFTHSLTLERPRSSTNSSFAISGTGDGNRAEEEEFQILPLQATAVMDVQQAEDKEGEGDHGNHTRPTHNWRNALQLQRSGEGNTESQAPKEGIERRKKADWRWNRSVRNQWDNNTGLFTKDGTPGVLQETSSSVKKEIDEEWKLPKSGRLETEIGTSWRQQKNLNVHSFKRKRIKDEIGYIKEWKDDETKSSKKLRQETYIQQQYGRKVDEKAMPNKRSSNGNEAEGSQCRRRNGRGWRCSQRTLVGYSLCDHHLGKSRLKSINSNNNNAATVTVNTKAGTCKLKELRLINASLIM